MECVCACGRTFQELKRFIAEREREIGILRDMIAQEKSQARHFQMEVYERDRKERELEDRLKELTSTIAFKDKEVLEIQHELEKTRKETLAAAAVSPVKQHGKALTTTSVDATSAASSTGVNKEDALAQAIEGAVNTDNDRLFEFLLEDSIDSLTESQPPDEEDLLNGASDLKGGRKGAATFRSLSKKATGGGEHTIRPLKLNPTGAPPPQPSTHHDTTRHDTHTHTHTHADADDWMFMFFHGNSQVGDGQGQDCGGQRQRRRAGDGDGDGSQEGRRRRHVDHHQQQPGGAQQQQEHEEGAHRHAAPTDAGRAACQRPTWQRRPSTRSRQQRQPAVP
jgi:hypothetical protein